MRKLRIFGIVAVIVLLVNSCSEDTTINTIRGTWSLVSYQCCLLPTENYDLQNVTWQFRNNKKLYIRINTVLDENSQLPFTEDVDIEYSYTDSEITIDNTTYTFTIDNDHLVLSDRPEVDGPILIFSR